MAHALEPPDADQAPRPPEPLGASGFNNMQRMSLPTYSIHGLGDANGSSEDDGKMGQTDRPRRLRSVFSSGNASWQHRGRPTLETLREVSQPSQTASASQHPRGLGSASGVGMSISYSSNNGFDQPTGAAESRLTDQSEQKQSAKLRPQIFRSLARFTMPAPGSSAAPIFKHILSAREPRPQATLSERAKDSTPKPPALGEDDHRHYWKSKSTRKPPPIFPPPPLDTQLGNSSFAQDLYSPSIHSAVAVADTDQDPLAASVAELMQEDELGW